MKDTVCCGCSLVCDDVAVAVQAGKLASLGLCKLGHEYCGAALNPARLTKPQLGKGGGPQGPAGVEQALGAAVSLLVRSKRPLLYGWSNSPSEVVRLGLELARRLHGVFDSSASLEYGDLLTHRLVGGEAQQVSLDEVRNRGEHIIYWGVNPAESHHRHASRFTVFPKGDQIPEGRESRTISVIDIRKTESMRLANHQLILNAAEGDVQLLAGLLKEVQGAGGATPDTVAGVPAIEFLSFAKSLRDADYIAIFYGTGLIQAPHAAKSLPLLVQLAAALNTKKRRCVTLPMVAYANTVGAVTACQTSAKQSFAADFASNPPTPHAGAVKGLVAGEFDAALVVGMDALSLLPGPAAHALRQLPIVSLAPLPSVTSASARVVIPTAVTGAEAGGTTARMDGTAVTLAPFHAPPAGVVTEEQALAELLKRLPK
jgi:formylmethanofuran dehydrogenase subunit B